MTTKIAEKAADCHSDLVQESKQLHSLIVTFQGSLAERQERLEHAAEYHSISGQVLLASTSACSVLHL